MECELKIGAVFSLAEDQELTSDTTASGNDYDNKSYDTTEYLLPDVNDNDDIDILSGMNFNKNTPMDITQSPAHDVIHPEDECSHDNSHSVYDSSEQVPSESTESCIATVVEDPDVPPSLFLENIPSPKLRQSSGSAGNEYMSPPILQLEEPLKKGGVHSQAKRKSCTKIYPCYIVLTKIDPVMKSRPSIPFREFKRTMNECSNMCKKIMFRRILREGRDVFNVKTPSKQKDYLIYLVKVEHERLRKSKKKVIPFPKLRDMLDRHDSKMAARMEGLGIGRVRRTISRIPTDFATRPTSPSIPDTNEPDESLINALSSAELELFDKRMRRKKYKMEMDSLKRLITIKRTSNLKLKRFKKARVECTETFLRFDVTSSVSGRVRKANSRYGGDFALCKRDIDEMIYVDEVQTLLKRSESENKKRVEIMKKDNERFARKRQISSNSTVNISSVKMPKSADLVIDNPEADVITQYESGIKKMNVNKSGKAKGDALKFMLNAHRTIDEHTTVKIPSVKANKTNKKKHNYNGDGVLIQDMPKEENVISGFLQNVSCDETSSSSPSLESRGYKSMKSEYEPGDQYVHAKQLLKKSLDKETSYLRTQFASEVEPNVVKQTFPKDKCVVYCDKSTDQDKYKKFKVPESVQKLFSIKKEPIDEGPAMVRESNNSKLVTVSYTNGVYKRVLLTHTNSASAESQVMQAKPVTSSNSPVLITTQDGLRYLVPQQWVPKTDTQRKLGLGIYSELIKAKLMAGIQKSDGFGAYTSKPLQTSCEPVSAGVTSVLSTIAHSSTTASNLHTHNRLQTEQLKQLHVNVLPGTPVQPNTATSVVDVQVLPNTNVVQNTLAKKPPIACLGKKNGTGVSKPASALSQSLSVIGNVSPVVQRQGFQGPAAPTQIRNNKNELAIHPKPTPISAINTSGNVVLPTNQRLPGIGHKPIDKCKFYLMKIDDKNILIPIDDDQAQPKTNNQDTVASIAAFSKVASPVGLKPTLIGLPSICGGVQVKPTLAVVPNMKQANPKFHTQFSLIPNSAVSDQSRSLLQTVTMTNLAGMISSNVVSKPSSLGVYSSSVMPVATSSVINVSNSVKPGTPKVDLRTVNSTSGLIAHTAKIPVTLVPVFLSQATSTPSTGNTYVTHLLDKPNTTSSVKSSLFFPITVKNSGFPVDIHSVKQEKSVSTSGPITSSSGVNVRIAKSSKQTNTTALSSCEMSGVVLTGEGCKGKSSTIECTDNEESEDVVEKPKAFAEAVTTREERLRRLKELLKERQKAVEEMRGNMK